MSEDEASPNTISEGWVREHFRRRLAHEESILLRETENILDQYQGYQYHDLTVCKDVRAGRVWMGILPGAVGRHET